MGRRLSGVNARAILAAILLVAAVAPASGLVGCREQRADRLYREAARKIERGDLAAAIERFDRILQEYPESRAAERAKADVVIYRGLLDASRRFPVRRAADLLIQTARAVERFHQGNGRWPSSLQEMVPAYLAAPPADPWGRPLDYREKAGGGYALGCRGADAAEGGDGENSDLLVEDGKFVKGSPEGIP